MFYYKSIYIILFRNGVDVEGASHKRVVDLIKNCTEDLHLIGKN